MKKRIVPLILGLCFAVASSFISYFGLFSPIDQLMISFFVSEGTEGLQSLDWLIEFLIHCGVILVLTYLLWRIPFSLSSFLFPILWLGECFVYIFLLRHQMYYPISNVFLLSFLSFSCVLLKHFLMEKRNKKKLVGTFSKYVSYDVEESIENKRDTLKLGGESKEIVVMFIDIVGFTKLSEETEPELVVEILNKYLAMATEIILRHGGMLDKYIGDGIMALFNAPKDLEDYAFKAVECAIELLGTEKNYALDVKEKYKKNLKFSIGIHKGMAIVGNIGCDRRMDYTAIGDTVNTASMLQSGAASNQILISEEMYQELKGRIKARCVGGKLFKNKKKEIVCYAVKEVRNND